MEKRDMSGALFKNTDKQKDTHPDAKGQATIAGVEYWVSAWKKTSKAGQVYTSLAFKLKEEKNNNQNSVDNDLPF